MNEAADDFVEIGQAAQRVDVSVFGDLGAIEARFQRVAQVLESAGEVAIVARGLREHGKCTGGVVETMSRRSLQQPIDIRNSRQPAETRPEECSQLKGVEQRGILLDRSFGQRERGRHVARADQECESVSGPRLMLGAALPRVERHDVCQVELRGDGVESHSEKPSGD